MKKIFVIMICALMVLSIAACGKTEVTLQLGQVIGAAHGTHCFTVTSALVEGDKVLAAFIDEYQYMAADSVTGVPNSDGGFGEYYAENVVLGSKKVNTEFYSGNMANRGGSTVALIDNYHAIEAYVAGKTIAELEALATGDAQAAIDAISGCTLADTAGYIGQIVEAAKAAQATAGVKFSGDVEGLVLNRVDAAAHGDKCYTIATTVVSEDVIVLSYIDEFQYMSGETIIGVPNSDALADNINAEKAGYVLASKRANAAYYSNNMATRGGSTVALDANYDAIQNYVNGKTISEIEALATGDAQAAIDAVSGCTLADTAGYLGALVSAAK